MRRHWTVGLGIVALTLPLAVVGMAGPASAATTTAPNEHVTITFNAATPKSPGAVTATGPIAGTGTATTSKNRHLGPVRLSVDVLTFSSGSVTVRDARLRDSHKLDATTCTATETSRGLFQITKGTGAYATAKGHGHFTMKATLVGTHDASSAHGCNMKNPTGSIVVDATGTVKL